MNRKLKSLALGIAVFISVFALMAPVQALPTVYGYVYGPDGVTPIDGAKVTATNMNDTSKSASVTTPVGGIPGKYEIDLWAQPGNKLNVVATYRDLIASTTITVPDPWAPVEVDLTLHSVAPTLTPIGLVVLVTMLSALAVVTMRRKRH